MTVDRPDNSETAGQDDGLIEASSQKRKRKWVLFGIAVLVLVVASGLYFVVKGGFGGSTDSGTANPSSDTSALGCTDQPKHTGVTKPSKAPTGESVEVSETGVTVGNHMSDGIPFTYGVELTNSAELVAKSVNVTVTVVRENDTPLPDYFNDGKPWKKSTTIPYIHPDRHFGIGSYGLTPFDGRDLDPKLKVDVEVSEWWEVDNDVHKFPLLTANVTGAGKDSFEYSVDSDYCETVGIAMVGALIRDDDGTIITGYDPGESAQRTVSKGSSHDRKFPAGTSKQWSFESVIPIPDSIFSFFDVRPDPSKSQVFPYIVDDDKK